MTSTTASRRVYLAGSVYKAVLHNSIPLQNCQLILYISNNKESVDFVNKKERARERECVCERERDRKQERESQSERKGAGKYPVHRDRRPAHENHGSHRLDTRDHL